MTIGDVISKYRKEHGLSMDKFAKLAMARGGWSNNATMQNIYQHLFSSDKKEAGKKSINISMHLRRTNRAGFSCAMACAIYS